MDWLIGGAEVLGGAASMAAGTFLAWVYRGGPADLTHIMVVPIAALVLIVVGLSVFIRGVGLW